MATYVTTAEAAGIIGVNTSRVRQYLLAGLLKGKKIPMGPQEEWRILETSCRKFKRPNGKRGRKNKS